MANVPSSLQVAEMVAIAASSFLSGIYLMSLTISWLSQYFDHIVNFSFVLSNDFSNAYAELQLWQLFTFISRRDWRHLHDYHPRPHPNYYWHLPPPPPPPAMACSLLPRACPKSRDRHLRSINLCLCSICEVTRRREPDRVWSRWADDDGDLPLRYLWGT